MAETIFQHPVLVRFILPFILIFTLIYAILEKTKLLGEDKHQINAIIAAVIGLVFVGFVGSTLVIQNMVLFLSIALVLLFMILLLWGFIFGTNEKGFALKKWMKWVLTIIVGVAFVGGVIWATGIGDQVVELLFRQSWSNAVWTNFLFMAIIAIILALVLAHKKSGGAK